jgi:hypothetical protein
MANDDQGLFPQNRSGGECSSAPSISDSSPILHVFVVFQGEGELWLGGIASLAVILVTVMAYRFAVSYLNQYPAESVEPSWFACDETIRNAKFDSKLQAVAVPVSKAERPIFDALSKQEFTLHLALINTAISCTKVSIVGIIQSLTYQLPGVTCTETNGTVSICVALPQHAITVRAILNDIQLVGGVRVGLFSPGQVTEQYTLQELNFNETFFSDDDETFSQQSTIKLALTKVSRSLRLVNSTDDDDDVHILDHQ